MKTVNHYFFLLFLLLESSLVHAQANQIKIQFYRVLILIPVLFVWIKITISLHQPLNGSREFLFIIPET